jgi:hypothetical protein
MNKRSRRSGRAAESTNSICARIQNSATSVEILRRTSGLESDDAVIETEPHLADPAKNGGCHNRVFQSGKNIL